MRAEDLMQTHTKRYRDIVELRLTGELDLATVPLLEAAAATALDSHPRRLYLDLAGLTFCDRTGLCALHQLTHRVHTARVSLHLTGLHPHLQRTLARYAPSTPCTPPVLRY